MITAFVLINVERGALGRVAELLAEAEGVAEVYSVAGEYDLLAVLRVHAYDDLSPLVTDRLATLEGITRTETLMAFRCYSRHDLDRMWGVGADPGLGEEPRPGERGPAVC